METALRAARSGADRLPHHGHCGRKRPPRAGQRPARAAAAAHPGGTLTWARAEQETARGRVACGWSLDGDRLTVTVTVPPGCTAILEVPTPDPGSVRCVPVAPSAGGATLRLVSGSHTVTATSC
ncbi:hypothetical protein Ade02nite_12940 [Paractinoplanes deccanensis]|uniref:Alpha-L-rhamnosidase C-terminal domain-containing protein n=1 Tax=Paractinoplanes deccanensis TaxID=113561 RepID=A0ABQ3XY45_9ACTN|nr:alpha-L-rhamnosidase C-terminal domain-containing protein [Actinoplanes deccanensis]GID72653.1 hypothetical protein Ade02nite_12940 [Actinoplanes deccanensis]